MKKENKMDRYLILMRDVCFNRPTHELKPRSFDSLSSFSEYLRGTILQEMLVPHSLHKVTCLVIDTEEIIQCDEEDVEELSEEVMQLLMAISNCKERYEVFRNKERLADGLEMQPGCSVIVRLPTMSGEISGKLRYKGQLHNKIGTHFGVELINARGKGNTNGYFHKYRYFDCPDESGVFLALNRVMSKKYDQFRTPVPAPRRTTLHKSSQSSSRSSLAPISNFSGRSLSSSYQPANSGVGRSTLPEPIVGLTEEEKNNLEVHIGMDVYIFTEVRGRESQERGVIKFIGRLPSEFPTPDIYVGIDLVNPVGNGRGVFNKRQLFQTKSNHAALVPLTGVLAASTVDDTPPLAAGIMEGQHSRSEQGNSEGKRRIVPRDHERIDAIPQSASLPRSKLYRSGISDYSSGFDMSNLKPHSVSTVPRLSYQRGMPDGGPITDFDEDLSSIDIYGGASGRQSSNDLKKLSTYQSSSVQKSATVKRDTKPYEVLYDAYYSDLEVGSMVEVNSGIDHLQIDGPVCGVIRWIGTLSQYPDSELMAGIESDKFIPALKDGTLRGERCFTCPEGRALFVYLKQCQRDPRFSGTGWLRQPLLASLAGIGFMPKEKCYSLGLI